VVCRFDLEPLLDLAFLKLSFNYQFKMAKVKPQTYTTFTIFIESYVTTLTKKSIY
jgi:hypothetical protein